MDKIVKSQTGQTIIILLLVMLVALSIGLAITQRSISDLSSSTNNEDSTRAFSAAEAGIEESLKSGSAIPNLSLGNQSSATVQITNNLPRPHQALEYPPIDKSQEAQFWLADPTTLAEFYPHGGNLNIYFGNPVPYSSDTPAIEVNIITKSTNSATGYVNTRYYFDPLTLALPGQTASRQSTNGFSNPNVNNSCQPTSGNYPAAINTTNSSNYDPNNPNNPAYQTRQFLCYVPITIPNPSGASGTDIPIMIRARILYSNTAQPIAVQPSPLNLSGPSLPYQARIYTSIGTSGQTQKIVQLFKLDNVVPAFFDFAIFSASPINK